MKCLVCQSESPEGKKYCSECGAELTQPGQTPEEQPIVAVSTEPKPRWLSAHWKGLVAVAVVLVVVLASVGLVYTLPLSNVKLLAYNQDDWDTIRIAVRIDGDLKATADLAPNSGGIVGVWSVDAGAHLITINCGYPNYPPVNPDAPPSWAQEVQVGPLYTKDVYAYLAPD